MEKRLAVAGFATSRLADAHRGSANTTTIKGKKHFTAYAMAVLLAAARQAVI